MKRLSDIRGENALDVIAEIIDPVVEICSDAEVESKYRSGRRVEFVRAMISNHKKAILKILAVLDGEDPSSYNPSLVDIPVKLLTLLNDPVFTEFFQSQGQNMEETSSGSATGNTEATGQE